MYTVVYNYAIIHLSYSTPHLPKPLPIYSVSVFDGLKINI